MIYIYVCMYDKIPDIRLLCDLFDPKFILHTSTVCLKIIELFV